MNQGDLAFIEHILGAIADIEVSVKSLSREEFQRSKDVRDACIRRIEIIGEAAKNLSREMRDKYPLVKWKKIVGARDLMIHSYFRVDLDIVWEIIIKDLPALKKQVMEIKRSLV